VDIITSGRHALGFKVEEQCKDVCICNKNLQTTLLIRQLKKQGRRLSEGGKQAKRQEHFIWQDDLIKTFLDNFVTLSILMILQVFVTLNL